MLERKGYRLDVGLGWHRFSRRGRGRGERTDTREGGRVECRCKLEDSSERGGGGEETDGVRGSARKTVSCETAKRFIACTGRK